MAEEGFKRKLTAIFSADAVEYSRLMAEDETATVKTIASYREIMATLIKQHRGRVVDSPGDNLLAEFSSVVDAVQCAVAVQNEFQTCNAELAENRRMEFRIGINLGDVIDEEGRIYGDGVNIAARLEALADPAGICVSKTAFDQIETKLPLGYEYLGEQSVKNIPKPVGAYRVLMKPDAAGKVIGEKRFLGSFSRKTAMVAIIALFIVAGGLIGWNIYLQQSKKVEPASVENMAFPFPEKPSIAVLPFTNMSGDPEQEYIADGITENIITALSMISEMFVISRNSTFTYKDKPSEIKQVGEDLGVKYVLEGSLMRSEDQVRVTAQLIDTTSGHHLWAEQYERKMTDFFTLMDEITLKIVMSLQVELTEGESAHLLHDATDNFEAWALRLKGTNLRISSSEKDQIVRARELFERAVKLDPTYATAWKELAWTHWDGAWFGWSESPEESIKKAIELGNKAKNLDETQAGVNRLFSYIQVYQKQFEKAITEAERAIAISPNDSASHACLAWALYSAGRFEEAAEVMKRAMRLSPYYDIWYLSNLGEALTMAGRYEEAISVNQQLLERGQKEKLPKWAFAAHAFLAIGYSMFGREEEARYHVAEALKIRPNWSLEKEQQIYSYKNPADMDRHLDALRKAGLPEHPPKKASD
ncbi:adenylate/guanylate cyclase domain-containing protein [Desulfobacterales bacterium]|nr:adenylate/guanylate cyclase domain-containing protein [Desulfobacterales bacterium]